MMKCQTTIVLYFEYDAPDTTSLDSGINGHDHLSDEKSVTSRESVMDSDMTFALDCVAQMENATALTHGLVTVEHFYEDDTHLIKTESVQ